MFSVAVDVDVSDVDLSPGNTVLCKITDGDEDLFFINSDGMSFM